MRLPEPYYRTGEHIGIELAGARAVFTTRRGGFSDGPYRSLNLGRWTDDDSATVERNRALLGEQLGVGFAYCRQVHGTSVIGVDAPSEPGSSPQQADGQATTTAGIGLAALTADCLPVAVAGTEAVAMLHAGWRGLADGVIGEGVRAVRALEGSGSLIAAIGPGAGPCCYEVGDEVRPEFARHGEAAFRGQNLDLKTIARLELERAGVDCIHDVGLCTICSPRSPFYSHRRDHGITGRQAGVAWLS
ncbi:MAG: peptidoglycan editing factor PgeF [Solirubrobacterales bacterium]|nr:peptidoglycan editing factor PgeF [Solirubrobacterales bacterium]